MTSRLAQFEEDLVRQRGLITRRQLIDGGLSEGQVRRLVHQQVLRRVRPGVLELVGMEPSWERGLLAIVLSVDGAVASHSSAARMWNLEPRPEDRYEITTTGPFRAPLIGVALHRSRVLVADDVTRIDSVVCTTFERTLCDCSTLLGNDQLGRALDAGLRRGVTSLRRLAACAERLESGPRRHMSAIRALLATRLPGFDPGGSAAELKVLEVLRRAGLPAPVQQYRVKVGSKTFRPDFAWPARKIFAEYYGLPFHTGASAVTHDSARLTALSAAGWLPLIFTAASSDREIIERTRAALEARSAVFAVDETLPDAS
jgi:hypothetical protein